MNALYAATATGRRMHLVDWDRTTITSTGEQHLTLCGSVADRIHDGEEPLCSRCETIDAQLATAELWAKHNGRCES